MMEWFNNLSDGNKIAIVVPVGLAAGGGLFALVKWVFRKKQSPTQVKGEGGIVQSAVGGGARQQVTVDRSQGRGGGVSIGSVESGATLNITVINYVDGLPQAPNLEVRGLFEEAQELSGSGEYMEAVKRFRKCLDIESDDEKRGALDIQIGNCYYNLREYLNAAEYYAAALRLSRKAGDREGEAAAQNNLGIAYTDLPAATGAERAGNVRKAVECYRAALEIYRKDEYPVDYAATQNNLGNAYMALPAATSAERADNVARAIGFYRAALEIRRKDEYPVGYAGTQNNLGNAYGDLPAGTGAERAANSERP